MPLLISVLLVLASGLVLWAAWRGRRYGWAGPSLLAAVALGSGLSLLYYSPQGDVAQAADALEAMERPGEAVALTDSLYTEAFQDAYDGHLWVWEVPSATEVRGRHDAVWAIGGDDLSPASSTSMAVAARFQVGMVRLDYVASGGQLFDALRIPASRLPPTRRQNTAVELAAVQLGCETIQRGQALSLALYWRALAPMDRSYTIFVQAINEASAKAGQIDSLPCDGACPTTTWRPGDLVGGWYNLPISASTAPGRYRVITDMYDLETGEHLAWTDRTGNSNTYLELGSIQVLP